MKGITPKADFLASHEGTEFADIQTQPAFISAVQIALQQMMMEQNDHARFEDDARAHVELQGAKRYVSILLNLTSPVPTPKTNQSGVLKCLSKPLSNPPQPKTRKPKGPPPAPMPRI